MDKENKNPFDLEEDKIYSTKRDSINYFKKVLSQ